MNSLQIRKLIYAALFLALAMVLPFLTGQIPQIGKSLCPMHIPALLCGFLCGSVSQWITLFYCSVIVAASWV